MARDGQGRWRRIGLRNAAEGAGAGLGAATTIGTMEWLSVASHVPLAAMVVIGTFHPPAGINPLLVSNNLPWSFLFAPVLAGAVLLAALPISGTAGSAAGRGRDAGAGAEAP